MAAPAPRMNNRPQGFQPSGHRQIDLSAAQVKRIRGYQKIAAGLIFIMIPSYELYRRLYKDGERKVQQGEFNPQDGTIKQYSEEEKRRHFKDSWLTRIFGEK